MMSTEEVISTGVMSSGVISEVGETVSDDGAPSMGGSAPTRRSITAGYVVSAVLGGSFEEDASGGRPLYWNVMHCRGGNGQYR